MLRIIIAGTEEYNDYPFLKETCLNIVAKEQYMREIPNKEVEFVSGHAPRGADYYGERFAKEYGFEPKLHPANWNDLDEVPCIPKTSHYGQYNALAGFNRNQRMADYAGENGVLIAFRIGNGNGTTDMIKRAKKSGLKVYQIDYDKDRKIKIWNGEKNETFILATKLQ